MIGFSIAYLLAILSPGPGVLSLAGVGAAYGSVIGRRYLIGLLIGTNLVWLAVVSGLAAVVLANPMIRTVLLTASTLYLLYLASRIAFAGAKVAFIEARGNPGIGTGMLLQAINPKAYAVGTVFFSGFAFIPDSFGTEVAIKFLIMNAVWIPIHLLWLWGGETLRRLDLAPHVQRRINYGMASAMLVVVGLAALSVLA